MDPLEFMLASLSMTDAEYALWSLGVAYVNQLKEELDYDEFNRTRLMPFLTIEVVSFLPILSIPTLFFCILVHGDIELKCLYQDAPAPSVPIDLPYLPWTSMLMTLMALLGSVPCLATQMSWAILFQIAHEQ